MPSPLAPVRSASRTLIQLDEGKINDVLNDLAEALVAHGGEILEANQKDLGRMDKDDPKYDRLLLSAERLKEIAADMKSVSSMDDAAARIRARVDKAFTAVQYQEPIDVELQGMPARFVEGRGKLQGKDVVFLILSFQHAEDRVGLLGMIGDPAVRKLYKTTVIDIATSIKPAASFYAGREPLARENPPPPGE